MQGKKVEFYRVAPLGEWNVHASLLPKFRGAAPVSAAILAGERETGVTIMRTDVGLDTGDMFLKRALPVGEDPGGWNVFDVVGDVADIRRVIAHLIGKVYNAPDTGHFPAAPF